MTDPLSHQIFKELEPPAINKKGYEKLLACYENGLERMRAIYKQDVIKSEPRNAQGRRAHWKFVEQGTKTTLIKRGMKGKQKEMRGIHKPVKKYLKIIINRRYALYAQNSVVILKHA